MSSFEIKGYFETLSDVSTGKILGTRKVDPEPGRAMGIAGRREITLTENTPLDSGPKKVSVTASAKRPRLCLSTVNPICGRMIYELPNTRK